MKYGRNIFNFDIMSLIMSLSVRSIDGDEGGGDPSAADIIFGKESPAAESSTDAPAVEESSVADKSEGEEGGTPLAPSEEKELEISDEDLLADLNPEESTDAKAERLARDYKASSKEAQRLSGEMKALVKYLEDQGLQVSVADDGSVNTVATEKYSDKVTDVSVKISDMPTDVQEAFESGDLEQIQPELKKIKDAMQKAFVRAQPTLDKAPVTISAEKSTAVFDEMIAKKAIDGEPLHENLGINKSLIETAVNNPALTPAFRQAFAENPELFISLYNPKINALRAAKSAENAAKKAANDKKKAEASESADVNVDASGSPKMTKSSSEAAADLTFGKKTR